MTRKTAPEITHVAVGTIGRKSRSFSVSVKFALQCFAYKIQQEYVILVNNEIADTQPKSRKSPSSITLLSLGCYLWTEVRLHHIGTPRKPTAAARSSPRTPGPAVANDIEPLLPGTGKNTELSSFCCAALSLNAARPTRIPAAKKIKEINSQSTPQAADVQTLKHTNKFDAVDVP